MTDVVLKRGRDRAVRRRHPWILSGAVAEADEHAAAGEWVRVLSGEGEVLGWGHWSPASQIRVRLLWLGKEEPPPDLLAKRVLAAVRRRESDPRLRGCDAIRLVNAEGDGLPGLIVDRYLDTLVVKLSTAGMMARRDELIPILQGATGAGAALERADTSAARREGLAARGGPLWGEIPEAPVRVVERGRIFRVDLREGQKTGFYLDQREARERVEGLAKGRSVLDLFSYTGGFSVAASRGGARTLTLVDSSAPALRLAKQNLVANGVGVPFRLEEEDAFAFARRDTGPYDLLVIDPPPLARRKRDVDRAARALKDLMLHSLGRAAPGALLLIFGCSHHVGLELFRKIVFGASLDAGRPLRVLDQFGPPSDHPVSLDHPEGAYLQGLLLEG